MTETSDLEVRLRALEGWAREHDGRINQKWEQQEEHNNRCDSEISRIHRDLDAKFSIVFKKLSALEVKVAAYAAAATAIVTVAAKYLLP